MEPVPQEQDIIVPALIILGALWFLATSAVKPEPAAPQPESAETGVSQEIAQNADSPSSSSDSPWFAQVIRN